MTEKSLNYDAVQTTGKTEKSLAVQMAEKPVNYATKSDSTLMQRRPPVEQTKARGGRASRTSWSGPSRADLRTQIYYPINCPPSSLPKGVNLSFRIGGYPLSLV